MTTTLPLLLRLPLLLGVMGAASPLPLEGFRPVPPPSLSDSARISGASMEGNHRFYSISIPRESGSSRPHSAHTPEGGSSPQHEPWRSDLRLIVAGPASKTPVDRNSDYHPSYDYASDNYDDQHSFDDTGWHQEELTNLERPTDRNERWKKRRDYRFQEWEPRAPEFQKSIYELGEDVVPLPEHEFADTLSRPKGTNSRWIIEDTHSKEAWSQSKQPNARFPSLKSQQKTAKVEAVPKYREQRNYNSNWKSNINQHYSDEEEKSKKFISNPYPRISNNFDVVNSTTTRYYNSIEFNFKNPKFEESEPVKNMSAEYLDYESLYDEFLAASYDGEYYDLLEETDVPESNNKSNIEVDLAVKNVSLEAISSPTRMQPPQDLYTTSKTTTSKPTTTHEKITRVVATTDTTTKKNNPTIKTTPVVITTDYSRPTPEDQTPKSTTRASSTEKPSATTEKTSTTTEIISTTTEITSTTVQLQTTSQKSSPKPLPPISLVEILQIMDIVLPKFLMQLRKHDSSLKQFTEILKRNKLSKSEIAKTKGDVGKLLNLIKGVGLTLPPTAAPSTILSTLDTTTIIPISSTVSNTLIPKITISKTSQDNLSHNDSSNSENSTFSSVTIESSTHKIFGFRSSNDVKVDIVTDKDVNISSIATTETLPTTDTVVLRPYKPPRSSWRDRMKDRYGVVGSRLGKTTKRPKYRPDYSIHSDTSKFIPYQDSDDKETKESNLGKKEKIYYTPTVIGLQNGVLPGDLNHPRYDNDPNSLNIATRSAIMAAAVLGGIALFIFVLILAFVMYKNHLVNRRKRIRLPMPLPSPSNSSYCSTPVPPIYSTRAKLSRANYQSDFWGTLRNKFEPYSYSSSTASYY